MPKGNVDITFSQKSHISFDTYYQLNSIQLKYVICQSGSSDDDISQINETRIYKHISLARDQVHYEVREPNMKNKCFWFI